MATRTTKKSDQKELNLNRETITVGTTTYEIVDNLNAGIYLELFTSHGSEGQGRMRKERFTFVAMVVEVSRDLPLRLLILSNAANLNSCVDGLSVGLDAVEPSKYKDGQLHHFVLETIEARKNASLQEVFEQRVEKILKTAITLTGSSNLNDKSLSFEYAKDGKF